MTIPKTGHTYTYAVITAPTTAATGILTGTCSRCNGKTTITLPKLTTTDYNYSVVQAAFCTVNGTGRYTWKTTSYGMYYFDVTIPQTGHSYTYAVTTAPTTSAAGVLTGTCSKCGGTSTVALPKLNAMDYSYSITTAATCTATGTGRYTWKTATYGTYYFDVAIAKTSHSYKGTVTASTCTAQGYTTHTCSVCGDSYKDNYTNALGHSWDAGTVTLEPTETEPGVKTFTCTRCGETKTETIPMLEPDPTPSLPCDGGDNCPGNKFTDMPAKGNSAHDAIDWAIVQKITSGTSTTTFSPSAGCTRAQVVTFLWRAAKEPAPTSKENPFKDVKESDYFYNAVLWAVEKGITVGTEADKFSPGETCTRAQIVTFLYRYEGKPEVKADESAFDDVKSADYFFAPVAWAVANGITKGTDPGKFSPSDTCTREQVVTFLYRDIAE